MPGHTKIPNTSLDDLMPIVTAPEWKVLCFVARKTIGWGKQEDALSGSQIAKGTGLSRRHIIRAIKSLEGCGLLVVRRRGGTDINVLSLGTRCHHASDTPTHDTPSGDSLSLGMGQADTTASDTPSEDLVTDGPTQKKGLKKDKETPKERDTPPYSPPAIVPRVDQAPEDEDLGRPSSPALPVPVPSAGAGTTAPPSSAPPPPPEPVRDALLALFYPGQAFARLPLGHQEGVMRAARKIETLGGTAEDIPARYQRYHAALQPGTKSSAWGFGDCYASLSNPEPAKRRRSTDVATDEEFDAMRAKWMSNRKDGG